MGNNNGSFFPSEKKWKYLSIVLMAILATGGALAPVAFAQNRPGPQAIWDAIDNLQSQINSLVATDESLESRIEALETENANKQQQIDALEARVDALEQEVGSGGDSDDNSGDNNTPPPNCDDGDPSTIDTVDDDGNCIHTQDPSYGDQDGDGFTSDEGDCDDSNPNINPDAVEIDGDFIDNNCNGIVDQA